MAVAVVQVDSKLVQHFLLQHKVIQSQLVVVVPLVVMAL
jgi:hypothetical protein